ncbi:hypothetical protein MSAN_00956700 [Mycena sanguinolenta]|uniref:Uncharacterized protein n=1 Tax=Mycena sanguinolenta TaxID=230812 RepID=A0A8H6Z070_9AGAR|nr:hypothetical protein MSAN_00956700 [Mycena sanguinolenta]
MPLRFLSNSVPLRFLAPAAQIYHYNKFVDTTHLSSLPLCLLSTSTTHQIPVMLRAPRPPPPKRRPRANREATPVPTPPPRSRRPSEKQALNGESRVRDGNLESEEPMLGADDGSDSDDSATFPSANVIRPLGDIPLPSQKPKPVTLGKTKRSMEPRTAARAFMWLPEGCGDAENSDVDNDVAERAPLRQIPTSPRTSSPPPRSSSPPPRSSSPTPHSSSPPPSRSSSPVRARNARIMIYWLVHPSQVH